jgi:predicted secreted protein
MIAFHRYATCLLLSGVAFGAMAQTVPPPQNVISLSASAMVEVSKDVLSIAFSTVREGSDAGAVQSQLKQAVDAALAEARKVAKPGLIDVQTGNFALYPRYSPKGGINGWQGSAELIVEGKDINGIAQLSGRITSLSIQRVGFLLSREAREKVEADVVAQAIARYRAKADSISKQFGFGNYAIREVSVSSDEQGSLNAAPLMRAQFAKSAGDEALSVEAGKAKVTANVSGSVQMSSK